MWWMGSVEGITRGMRLRCQIQADSPLSLRGGACLRLLLRGDHGIDELHEMFADAFHSDALQARLRAFDQEIEVRGYFISPQEPTPCRRQR